ncbi:uncharacterized protein LOC113319093 [Papaver somniferum]|uniref:uncharacterized protein LOC113319093 n=1 Tax=Papaver somniferum TaxID=3469 RepID=UPI000E6F7E49|nr:uncharacterized protein LOC113319093 [Papaver somniferum]
MLPFEIIAEILSRVPAESILECKSVSKPWRNVVQHPSFSQKHLNHINDLDSDDSAGLCWLLPGKWSNILVESQAQHLEISMPQCNQSYNRERGDPGFLHD